MAIVVDDLDSIEVHASSLEQETVLVWSASHISSDLDRKL